jgi:hypothetical protein
MRKYIKLFDTHAKYEDAESSLILPNVSFCLDTTGEVHYNPFVTCEETSIYEIVGTPSYPSEIEGSAASFDISFNYKRTDIDTACTETVTEGSDSVTVECGQNPSTADSRVVSGTVVWNGIEIEYSITQSKFVQPRVWIRLTKEFSKTTPIYKVGILNNAKNSQRDGGRMMFGSTPNACPTSTGLHNTSRIYVNNYELANTSSVHRGTCSQMTYESGWQSLSTLGFVLQTIELSDGTDVANVWVYDNETGNTPYDTETGPVYFYEPQLYVTNFNQYFIYIDSENA